MALCDHAMRGAPACVGVHHGDRHRKRCSADRISRGRTFYRLPPGIARIHGPHHTAGGSAMTDIAASTSRRSPILAFVDSMIGLLDRVPYSLLALPLHAGAATVFWNSAMAKLANWDTTIELFTEEYKVPLLPPEIAANLALSIEL